MLRMQVAAKDGRDLLVFETRDGSAHFVDNKTLARLMRAGVLASRSSYV